MYKLFAVRGVTGSGDTAVASSNGFYIDDSPPVFDQEVMSAIFYYDVGQGEYTPVKFQKSNDTIKCIWKCDDKESDIMVRINSGNNLKNEFDIPYVYSRYANLIEIWLSTLHEA